MFETWPSLESEPIVVERAFLRRRWMAWGAAAAVLLLLLVPIAVFAAVWRESRESQPRGADAIVVLGAAQFNGVPSMVFRARLDTAYQLYQQGYAPIIAVTGGRLSGDRFTEAEAGKAYLVERGVPADAILMENVSHNTAESFQGLERLLEPRGVGSLLLVSDGFHLYRSKMLAEAAGFEATGVAAANSPIRAGSMTELRYLLRETVGVIAWKLHIKR